MSTKDVLSEEEIDALMDTVEDTPADPEAMDANGDYPLFDFASRENALLDQMPALKTINEKVCNELTDTLNQSFQFPIEVEMESMELLKLEECLKSMAEFSAINLLKFDIASGLSLVVVGGGLLSQVINRYFGSSFGGAGLPQSERQLTATEARMNERILSHVLAAAQVGWEEVSPLEVKLLSTETNPAFVKLGSPADMAVRFKIKITMDEFSESVQWLLPYAALEAMRPKLGNLSRSLTDPNNLKNWTKLLERQMCSVELDLTANFTELCLSLKDVLSLKVGSIIPMKVPDCVEVFAGDVPLFAAEYGCHDNNKALSMKHRIKANA